MGEAYTIEEAPQLSEADWRRLNNLLLDSFAEFEDRIDPPSSMFATSVGDLKRKAETETLLVAYDADLRPIGVLFARAEPDHLYLGKLAVAPQRRGEGIAKALFRRSFSIADREGIVLLRLQTRIELTKNRAVFESFGFEKTGETAHEGYERPTSITMERRL